MAEISLGTGNVPGPSLFDQKVAPMTPGVITTTTDQLFAMARKSSLWTLTFRAGLLRHRDDFHLHGASRL